MNDGGGNPSSAGVRARSRARSLAPADVAARLACLRQLHVPEREDEARARLAASRVTPKEPFALAVQRRLRELGSLVELADYLHGKKRR